MFASSMSERDILFFVMFRVIWWIAWPETKDTIHEETMKSGSPLVSYGLVFTNAQNQKRRRPGNENIGIRPEQVQERGMCIRGRERRASISAGKHQAGRVARSAGGDRAGSGGD